MSKIWNVEAMIHNMAMAPNPIDHVYPKTVSEELGLSIDLVFEHLLILTKQEKLFLRCNVCCPSCLSTISRPNGEAFESGEILTCSHGHSFELTRDSLSPFFVLNPDFCEYIKKGYWD